MAWYLPQRSAFFPHPFTAEEDGLLAFGGKLSCDNILLAYSFGIFPWYNEGDPILWWSTHPRLVIKKEDFKIKKSLRNIINRNLFTVTYNQAFKSVIEECKKIPRRDQFGTWITKDIINVFCELHEKGHAHSVEVWQDDVLVGGVYGLAIGHVFFGESMFSRVSNASQVGFVSLARKLFNSGYDLIDCQQETDHLKQFGAMLIEREEFHSLLKANILNPNIPINWV